ncbi:MAG: hypothetical protein QOF10_2544 [Kribbellaceae bacterium]|nr:hypothetical protein [Kribbellaceae bacterium]
MYDGTNKVQPIVMAANSSRVSAQASPQVTDQTRRNGDHLHRTAEPVAGRRPGSVGWAAVDGVEAFDAW